MTNDSPYAAPPPSRGEIETALEDSTAISEKNHGGVSFRRLAIEDCKL